MSRQNIKHLANGTLPPFVGVPNEVARDFRLSSNAFRVLTYILSYDPGWSTSKRRLAEQTNLGIHAVRKAVDQLVELGYCQTEQSDPDDPSTIDYRFTFFPEDAPEQGDESPPVRKSDQPPCDNRRGAYEEIRPQQKKQSTKDYQSNKHAPAHEDQPPDPHDDPPPSLDAYILHIASKLNYDVSPGMATSVALRVAGSGLTDDDERRYILDSMASRAANDKPPGKWAHYCGQKSDVEQWQGDSGGETGNAGMDLFNRLD